MKIDKIRLYRVRLPLHEPYSLSFGTITEFDVLMTEVKAGQRTEWSEVVPLRGYSGTGFEETYQGLRSVCDEISGMNVDEAVEVTERVAHEKPFAVSGVAPALEILKGDFGSEGYRMPLSGIVSSGEGIGESLSEIERSGYEVVKLKAHGDVSRDIALVREALDGCDLPVRVDANQAYGLEDAIRFADSTSDHPESGRIRVFEQPLPTDCWEGTRELRRESTIPIGLDESIWGVEDVERAADCADVVKLKLAKHGLIGKSIEVAKTAHENDLEVLLGNGVAGGLSAVYESIIWHDCGMRTAGENNGYLKHSGSVLEYPAKFDSGDFVPPSRLLVDNEKVADKTVECREY